MVPGNSSAASWWMNLLSCYHDIFKAKPLSKTITPSLLALVSPALAPSPSFGFENERINCKNTGVGCHSLLQGIFPTQRSNPGLLPCRQILKLPNNGFTFSPIILVSVGMPFLKQSCTHVKAGFSLWDKQVFLKKNKGFELAGVAATMASQISLFFFFIYLEMEGRHSCRLQAMVHTKYSGLLLFAWWLCFLSALLASLGALRLGPLELFKVYGIAVNTTQNRREPQEITFYCSMWFTGEMNCSQGDD